MVTDLIHLDPRPSHRESDREYFLCICCGHYSLDTAEAADICGNCGWVDDPECIKHSESVVRPNYLSYSDARSLCMKYGSPALCAVNCASGFDPKQISAMTPEELASLQTLDQRVRGVTVKYRKH
ncbi:MAG: CPCC family cysteine-rich protein [Phycisphaerales bacterium JB058]